jgi:hypothetical protein
VRYVDMQHYPRLRSLPTSHDVAATGCHNASARPPEWANTHKATCPAAPYADLAVGLFFRAGGMGRNKSAASMLGFGTPPAPGRSIATGLSIGPSTDRHLSARWA